MALLSLVARWMLPGVQRQRVCCQPLTVWASNCRDVLQRLGRVLGRPDKTEAGRTIPAASRVVSGDVAW